MQAGETGRQTGSKDKPLSRRKPPEKSGGSSLIEKSIFAKLNKFAGEEIVSQKASPCANLFLNQRKERNPDRFPQNLLVLSTPFLPPKALALTFIDRPSRRKKSGGFHCYTAF